MKKVLPKLITVTLAVPVYNEQQQLEKNIKKLNSFITENKFSNFSIQIVIVDNGSTDDTPNIGNTLEREIENVTYLRLEEKGRGRALRAIWMKSEADILSYMDVDLSADLESVYPLLSIVASKDAEIAIGSRLMKESDVKGRTRAREIMSRSYNFLVQVLLNVKIKDAQCGFKAIQRDAFRTIEPKIQNQNWFFDTELLVIASKMGLRIHEIPVKWTDDPGSTVKIARTAMEDIHGIMRLVKEKPWL